MDLTDAQREFYANVMVGLTYMAAAFLAGFFVYRLTRVILTPLEVTEVPSQRVPLYPGEDLGTVKFTVGGDAKAWRIIKYAVGVLAAIGAMCAMFWTAKVHGYPPFDINGAWRNSAVCLQVLWPVALCVAAIILAVRNHAKQQ